MQTPFYFEEDTLDDLLVNVLKKLLKPQKTFQATQGEFTEIFGGFLVLKNPLARLSRSESRGKIFSALGELFWYLSGTNSHKFIEYYISRDKAYVKETNDDNSVRNGYGERLFNFNKINQIENVINLLRQKPTSRQAVIQLFDASDLSQKFKAIPCTCTLQFLKREDKLNLLVNMRSNDAYIGLPHDIFAFTMLQELIARTIGCEVGIYKHCVGSLHLYTHDKKMAQTYVSEGWQSPIPMAPMPSGNPWNAIKAVQKVEEALRNQNNISIDQQGLPQYWEDICHLFSFFQQIKTKKVDESICEEVKRKMSCRTFDIFINARLDMLDTINLR